MSLRGEIKPLQNVILKVVAKHASTCIHIVYDQEVFLQEMYWLSESSQTPVETCNPCF